MKKYSSLILFSFLFHSCIIPIDTHTKSQYAINENFASNEIGWIEEQNEIHELEIKNGYYFLNSKDTSFNYTSTSPLDKSFLYGLNPLCI